MIRKITTTVVVLIFLLLSYPLLLLIYQNIFLIDFSLAAMISTLSRSAWVIPGGASGHPGSPHYADQIEPYAKLRMHPILYDWDVIARQAGTSQRLEPGRE